MKKFILGFLLGIGALALFVYFGGGAYVKSLGKRTERAGAVIEKYEKSMKKAVKGAKETAEEKVEKTKERVTDKTDRVKELIP